MIASRLDKVALRRRAKAEQIDPRISRLGRRKPRRPDYSRTFYQHLPTPPKQGSVAGAKDYYRAIARLIERGGWSHDEWTGLRRLERRWRRRMQGDDPRWLIVGPRAGRLPSTLETALRPAQAAAKHWTREHVDLRENVAPSDAQGERVALWPVDLNRDSERVPGPGYIDDGGDDLELDPSAQDCVPERDEREE